MSSPPPTLRTLRGVLIFALGVPLAASLLTGCSHSIGTQDTVATLSLAADQLPPDPCALVTTAQISAVMAQPVQDHHQGGPMPALGERVCIWFGSNGGTAQIHTLNSASLEAAANAGPEPGGMPTDLSSYFAAFARGEPVSGVGDRGKLLNQGGELTLTVVSRDRAVVIDISGGPVGNDPTELVALGRQVAANLATAASTTPPPANSSPETPPTPPPDPPTATSTATP